jgi:CheY-like chemotaxis protein/two-component sensor histidine kinase
VAHDFNNVLTVIQSYAEMGLEHTSPRNDFLWEAFSEILAAAEHATALTSKLLAFGRQQLADRRAIDVNDTLHALGRLLSRLLRANVDVEFDASSDTCVVSAAPIELEQIVMNLCINGGDAMPDGGRLTIRTRSLQRTDRDTGFESPFVCLSVIDTGSGIDKDHMPRIFDPFYTTKAVGEGSGLGLSVVHGIVTQLGGEIVVDTERGRGTAFHIYLPRVEARVHTHAESMVGRLTKGTETILLADDQERICALLARMLEAEGYRTLCVADGEQALQMFDEHRDEIDLAVLDVVMPKLGGRQVCDHIAKHRPDLPILFISGYTADALPPSYLDHPLRDLLLKPYPARTLLAAVRNMLDRANRHIAANHG